MKILLKEAVKDNKRLILDRVLIIQAIVLLIVLIIITGIEVTPRRIMDYLMLLWFYWIYLKSKNLLRNIKIIDAQIVDDFNESGRELPTEYKPLKHYIKKANQLTVPLTIITIVFLGISIYKPFLRDIFLFLVFIDNLMFFLGRIITIKRFIANVIDVYKASSKAYNNLEKFPSLRKIFLEGATVGLLYLFMVYNLFEMSAFHYFLYYFVFSSLLALSIILVSTYKYLASAIKNIDSLRLKQ